MKDDKMSVMVSVKGKVNEMLTCNGKRITRFRGLKLILFTPVSLCGRSLTRFAYSRRNGRLRRKKYRCVTKWCATHELAMNLCFGTSLERPALRIVKRC